MKKAVCIVVLLLALLGAGACGSGDQDWEKPTAWQKGSVFVNGAELEGLYDRVEAEEVSGGTDIYAAAAEGLRQLAAYDLTRYTPAVILMTDGVSDGSPDDFRQVYEDLDADVPVFSIMFGSADPTQLESLAELTHARVFDGREDLIGAFRSVKGYN